MIEGLLEQLAQELEIKNFASSLPGVYTIPVDETLSITLKEQAGCLNFTAAIGDLPTEKQEEFLMHAMHANLFGQGTTDGYLAISQETSRLTLTRVIDYTIDYRDFKDAVDDFIIACDLWIEEVTHFGQKHAS